MIIKIEISTMKLSKNFIEDQLNCKFICYNPNAKDSTIERVLNTI